MRVPAASTTAAKASADARTVGGRANRQNAQSISQKAVSGSVRVVVNDQSSSGVRHTIARKKKAPSPAPYTNARRAPSATVAAPNAKDVMRPTARPSPNSCCGRPYRKGSSGAWKYAKSR